ncbi:DUF58 domain-containing protein [Paenibacillus sp. GCM10012306]|uniref:DUF58 domain-containing protein n=1 Tax=Paenibacillus sp. GCM10012306 TaxID=3317342 RepID=UPI003619133D
MLSAGGVIGVLYAWRGGQALLFLLSIVVLLLLGGLLLQLFGPRRIKVERTVTPARPVAGDTLRVQVQVSFISRIPLPWMIIFDDWGSVWHQELLFPGFRRSFSYSYTLKELPRGVQRLRACKAVWGDLPGWFTGSSKPAGEATVKVMPAPLYFRWSAPEGGVLPDQIRMAKWSRGGSEEAVDIRQYAPGDPLNRIHWKNSARRGVLQSRVPEKERGRMICVVLDNCAASYEVPYGALVARGRRGERPSGFEQAVSAATGQLLAAEHSGAYMQLFTGGWPEGLARHEGLGKVPARVLDMLTEIAPNGARSLPELLEDAARGWIPGMAVAVITGRLTEDSAKAIARYLVQGVKMDLYYVWDLPAPQGGSTGREESSSAGSISDSLRRLGATLFCLDGALPAYGHGEVEFHESAGKPTIR